MKKILGLVLAVGLTLGAAAADIELPGIPFELGKQHFQPGDSIVIEQVLATSPKLSVGDTVMVRGHYRLASAPKATLGLFVTHNSPAPRDNGVRTQTAKIETASGAFELSCEIAYAGALHVSFYPATGGEAFGGVYFKCAASAAKTTNLTPASAPSGSH